MFQFRDRVLYDIVSGVVYEYKCGRSYSSYYGKRERPLKVRSGADIGVWPVNFK